MISSKNLSEPDEKFTDSEKFRRIASDLLSPRIEINSEEKVDNASRNFTVYSLFKSERLSVNNKLTLHNALIRSLMTYACPAWEFEADTHLLKLQRLQNKLVHHW
jgi:hypothetical protein